MSLFEFGVKYFPHWLTSPCAEMHRELCARIEAALVPGGRFVGVLQREGGKTTWSLILTLWRASNESGLPPLVRLWGPRPEVEYRQMKIQKEIGSNTALLADFPGLQVVEGYRGKVLLKNGTLIESATPGMPPRVHDAGRFGCPLDIFDDSGVRPPATAPEGSVIYLSSTATEWQQPAIVNGAPTWPERWTIESLKERERQMGHKAFAREYLCEVQE